MRAAAESPDSFFHLVNVVLYGSPAACHRTVTIRHSPQFILHSLIPRQRRPTMVDGTLFEEPSFQYSNVVLLSESLRVEQQQELFFLHTVQYHKELFWWPSRNTPCLKKLCQCYFVNNSVKHWPTLIIFGVQHREET